MSATPFLSIIIPVYNAEPYLAVCIDSMIRQTFTDYEVILVDDGSTDTSGTICDEYASKYSQVHVIHQENAGHTLARQTGFRASRGTYIAFADSDDWVADSMYSDMCRAAHETHADIIHCDFTAVMKTGDQKCSIPFPAGYYDKAGLLQAVYPRLIYSGTFFTFGAAPNLWNKLFKRPLLERYLFRVPPAIKIGEDGLITYSCLLAADSVYFTDAALYYYRSNSNSLCHSIDKDMLAKNHLLFDAYLRLIDTKKYPMLAGQLHYFFVYQSLLIMIPIFREMTQEKDVRKQFIAECSYPVIRDAFAHVDLRKINGTHNKLYAFAIRHRLYRLFVFLLN